MLLSHQDILSWIYYLLFVVYGFSLWSIARARPATQKSKILAGLLASLMLWALFISLSNAAPDAGNALSYRKLAVFGWGTMYSFLLHLVLILVKARRVSTRWWGLVLVYLPAVLNVLAFVVFWNHADRHFNIVATNYGWTNVFVDTFWNWFQTVYYISFSLLIIVLEVRWFITTPSSKSRTQGKWVALSFLLSVVLGGFTDYFGGWLFGGTVPQLGIVFILGPVMVFLYLSLKHDFIDAKISRAPQGADDILDEGAREALYARISYPLFILAILNLAYRALLLKDYSSQGLLVEGFLIGLILVLAAVLIYNAKRLSLSILMQEILITLVLCAIMLYGSFSLGQSLGLSLWSFVFTLILLSAVFSHTRVMLLGVLLLTLAQLLLDIRQPGHWSAQAYVLRLLAVGLATALAYRINRIFMARLREGAENLRFQQALNDISFRMNPEHSEEYQEVLLGALSAIGDYLHNKRAIYLETDQEGLLLDCSQSACSLDTSKEQAQMAGQLYSGLISGFAHVEQGEIYYLDQQDLDPASLTAQHLKEQGIATLAYSPIAKQGQRYSLLVLEFEQKLGQLSQSAKDFLRIFANTLSSFHAHSKAQETLRHLAYHDSLTDSLKHERFIQLTEERIRKAPPGFVVPLLYIDVDEFKEVNNTAGHTVGNQVLRVIADRLRTLRKAHFALGKFSGDIMLYATTMKSVGEVHQLAREVLKAISEPLLVEGIEFHLTASVGVAIYPQDAQDAVSLMSNADFAVLEAKSQGGNQFSMYSFEKRNQSERALRMKSHLYSGIQNHELFLVFQPQVSLKTGRIAGVEALLRWKNPELGFVSPAEFIPIAEQTGLIVDIGDWVMQAACQQAVDWQKAGLPPIRMGVNVSFLQLLSPGFAKRVAKILKKTGLDPALLEIEITESATGRYGDQIQQTINDLLHLGLHMAIDDYGSDYSALGRLSNFSIDRIKIDKSLIDDLTDQNTKRRVIVQNIITLAKELKLQITAEGVELQEQAEYLRQAGCDEAQGYLFYRPMPAQDVEIALQAQNNLPGLPI